MPDPCSSVPAYQMALSVLRQCASSHTHQAESARAIHVVSSSAGRPVEFKIEGHCRKRVLQDRPCPDAAGPQTKYPARNRGQCSRKSDGPCHLSPAHQPDRVRLDRVIAGLAVVLSRVLELLDATAETAHQLRNFAASEQQENDQNDQNDLSRSNGSHPMEFVTKVGEKEARLPNLGNQFGTGRLSMRRTPPQCAATMARRARLGAVRIQESSASTTARYSTSHPVAAAAYVARPLPAIST